MIRPGYMWNWNSLCLAEGLQDLLRHVDANRGAILSVDVHYDPDLVDRSPWQVGPAADPPFNYYGIPEPDLEI